MAKLTIQSGIPLKPDPQIIETVRSCLYEMNRVEKIDITTIRGSTLKKILRNLPKSAPQLHTLCIGCYDKVSIHEDFLYDTERLQRVELTCKISWDSRFLTGLTRLTLSGPLKANSSIVQVLHALQRMPALIELDLGKHSIPDDSEGQSTYPVVDLPCLRKLRISSGVGALTTVLRHITFPHSAILILTCEEYQSTKIDFSNFLSVLDTKFLSSSVIRSLTLQYPEEGDDSETKALEFCLLTTANIQDGFPSSLLSAQSQVQLVLKWPSSQNYSYVKALTCAFDAMSLPFLTQLRISCLDFIDSQTWVKTFRNFPLLERVSVHSWAIHSFLEALVYKTMGAERSKTAYRNVSFPNLRYIHLIGAHFRTECISVVNQLDMLLDCLMERCERNAEVQVLRLDDCFILSSDVERLKEIVVDVDVFWERGRIAGFLSRGGGSFRIIY
jgi:hypothetical protein